MQVILVSRHLRAARTLTIMPWHVVAALMLFCLLVFATSAAFSWLSVRYRLPMVEELMISVHQREVHKSQEFIHHNLELLAGRLGELQARVMALETIGERIGELTGTRREAGRKESPDAGGGGQGGPFVPAPLSAEALAQEIAALATRLERRSDELSELESRLLEKKIRQRLLPTTLPVAGAALGSPYGYRSDPILGERALHDGMDFNAPQGSPVLAAAEGVVVIAEYRPDYGNYVEVDHGGGLSSLYAHLAHSQVRVGQLLRRGEVLGALGSTGRSTGPHLHFEVRMFGTPQNPAVFLRQANDLARLSTR